MIRVSRLERVGVCRQAMVVRRETQGSERIIEEGGIEGRQEVVE